MGISLDSAGMLLGGLGLLLIGMSLMTEGLKLAAGSALRDILARWTSNRVRGLLSGFGITTLVQSSSAVTVATIGFANANLLSLQQAVWVIFGSNVGTTMTGWIVALVGFKLNVEAFALPLVGFGVMLKISGERSRRAAFGQALVGFGLLFLGIGVLKETFDAFGEHMTLPILEGPALLTTGVYVLAGVLLTTVMQSSSAALVVALSAAEGGMIPLAAAAAVVIGANLGTTTTALIAVWGATPTAKRVALSHVAFNIVTATVAITILQPMLLLVEWLREAFALPAAPATTLAVFHSAFNVLGVLLMWPVADRMIAFLLRRFQSQEEVESRPKFLDTTSLGLPYIAGEALANEVGRVSTIARGAVLSALSVEGASAQTMEREQHIARSLIGAIGSYSAALGRMELPEAIATLLPSYLRSAQQSASVIEIAQQMIAVQAELGELSDERLDEPVQVFRREAVRVIEAVGTGQAETDPAQTDVMIGELDRVYEEAKLAALHEGVSGRLGVLQMDALLRYLALSRRGAKQLAKAARRLTVIRTALDAGQTAPGAHEGKNADDEGFEALSDRT